MESNVGVGVFEVAKDVSRRLVPAVVQNSQHFTEVLLVFGILEKLLEREVVDPPAFMVEEGVVDVKRSEGADVPSDDFGIRHGSVADGLVESDGDFREGSDSSSVGERGSDGGGKSGERNHFFAGERRDQLVRVVWR